MKRKETWNVKKLYKQVKETWNVKKLYKQVKETWNVKKLYKQVIETWNVKKLYKQVIELILSYSFLSECCLCTYAMCKYIFHKISKS